MRKSLVHVEEVYLVAKIWHQHFRKALSLSGKMSLIVHTCHFLWAWALPYLPAYNACPCIIRIPSLDCTFEKKKISRKQKWLRENSAKMTWFGNTQKATTWSSLQKCNLMHRPWNDQFFQWTLLAVSNCKIMDTVHYPLHPALWLLSEHYGLGNWGESARN